MRVYQVYQWQSYKILWLIRFCSDAYYCFKQTFFHWIFNMRWLNILTLRAACVDERKDLALFDKAFHAADLWPHIYRRQRSRSSNQIISANLPRNKIYISFFTVCRRALQSLTCTWNPASAGCNPSNDKSFQVTNPGLLFVIIDWKATLLRCKRAPGCTFHPPNALELIIISQIVLWTSSFLTKLARGMAVCWAFSVCCF